MTYDGPSPRLLLVDHDDAEREYAYESVAGTFETDESILDHPQPASGWTVASIRNDWATRPSPRRDGRAPAMSDDDVTAFYEQHPYPPPVDDLDRQIEAWRDGVAATSRASSDLAVGQTP